MRGSDDVCAAAITRQSCPAVNMKAAAGWETSGVQGCLKCELALKYRPGFPVEYVNSGEAF
jgi:hypothetical protein